MNLINDYQRVLFPYAYNILGSAEDARDAIQEVMTRYLTLGRDQPENELGYLIRGVVNQSINTRNRNQRVRVVADNWLPEPVATEAADDHVARKDILSFSLLLLLEHLNVRERAVFVLREAFDYTHEEIGAVLDLSVENARKILSRAKSKLKHADKEKAEQPKDWQTTLGAYMDAIRNGDTALLTSLMSKEIAATIDGGSLNIVKRFTYGAAETAALLLYAHKTFQRDFSVVPVTVNHQPGLLFKKEGVVVTCQVFEMDAQEKILRIYTVLDPGKLKNIADPI